MAVVVWHVWGGDGKGEGYGRCGGLWGAEMEVVGGVETGRGRKREKEGGRRERGVGGLVDSRYGKLGCIDVVGFILSTWFVGICG